MPVCVRSREASRAVLSPPLKASYHYSAASLPEPQHGPSQADACLITPNLTPEPGSPAPVKHGKDGSPFCALAPPQEKVTWEVDRLQRDAQLPGDGQVQQRHADGDSCSAGQHLRDEGCGGLGGPGAGSISLAPHASFRATFRSGPESSTLSRSLPLPPALDRVSLQSHPAPSVFQVLALLVCTTPTPNPLLLAFICFFRARYGSWSFVHTGGQASHHLAVAHT